MGVLEIDDRPKQTKTERIEVLFDRQRALARSAQLGGPRVWDDAHIQRFVSLSETLQDMTPKSGSYSFLIKPSDFDRVTQALIETVYDRSNEMRSLMAIAAYIGTRGVHYEGGKKG